MSANPSVFDYPKRPKNYFYVEDDKDKFEVSELSKQKDIIEQYLKNEKNNEAEPFVTRVLSPSIAISSVMKSTVNEVSSIGSAAFTGFKSPFLSLNDGWKSIIESMPIPAYGYTDSHNVKKRVDGESVGNLSKEQLTVFEKLSSEDFVGKIFSYFSGDAENFIIILNDNNADITEKLSDIYFELFDEFETSAPDYMFEFETRNIVNFSESLLPQKATEINKRDRDHADD